MFKKEDLWASNGHPKTTSLFSEICKHTDNPILSLNGGNPNLPCLRDMFIPLVVADPTEVTFAEAVFNDVRYWMKLREAKALQPYLKEWRDICDISRKRDAFKSIVEEAKDGKNRLAAAKYLIEEPWKGRSKVTKEKVKDTAIKAHSVYAEDIDRLREEGLIN